MKSIKDVLEDQEAPALAVLGVCLRHFGSDFLGWDTDTVTLEIKDDFNVDLSDLQHDKLMGATIVLCSDAYEQDWQTFETVSHLFNNQYDDFFTDNELEWDELIQGLVQVYLIKHEPLEFSDEVKAYAGNVFAKFGMSKAPDLFPNAIMPQGLVDCDDSEKNAALKELFDAVTERTTRYINEIDKGE